MAHKHQVKVSSKRNRTKAGRKYRRQERESLRDVVRRGGAFRQHRTRAM
jgi:hypothetical protein